MKRLVDILLFVEHSARELDVACALKHLTAKRHGLTLEITSYVYDVATALAQYRPQVAVIPYCYSAQDPGTREILPHWNEATYVNLAYEQVYSRINLSLKSPKDGFARKHVLHHAWGKFYVDFLCQHGVPLEHTFLNGNPTYSLYQPPYSAYFPSKAELANRHGLDANKPWILIPENYGAAFYTDTMVRDYIHRGYSEAQAYGYREFATASLREAVHWWYETAQRGDVEVIVRPRPMIPHERFADACRKIAGELPARLRILKEGTVREWILAADVVASSYSTTLIEAAIAGKPIAMLTPVPYPDYLQAEWYPLVPQVTNRDEFERATTPSADPETGHALRAWAEGGMLRHRDPIGNLANFLAAVCLRQRPLPPAVDLTHLQTAESPKPPPLTGWRKARRKLGRTWNRIRGAQRSQVFNTHEQDCFTEADVASRTERWATILR